MMHVALQQWFRLFRQMTLWGLLCLMSTSSLAHANVYNPHNDNTFHDSSIVLGIGITLDKHLGQYDEPLSLHKYLYCHANPVNNIDPTGQFSLPALTVANCIRAIGYSFAAVAIVDLGITRFSGRYNSGVDDLTDPSRLYRKAIIDSARANRLDPAFLAAIIATELDDLNWKDYLGDVPGYTFGNSTIGWAQITPRNVKRLHPDFGRWKRFGMAIHPETSIRLAAELIRTVADEGAKNPDLKDFKCNAAWVHPADFANDGSTWTEAMMTAAAYNYTQMEWYIEVNPLGERDMVFSQQAGGYGIGAIKHYRELKGKFDE